jgi:hypothetical protein
VTTTHRATGIGLVSTLLLILMFLIGSAPKTDAAPPETVHIRGVVYSFFGIDEHAPGAIIRVDEFPGISAPVALDGSYDIEVPDNSNVTLYVEPPATYVKTYLQTFRTSGEDIEKAHFQLPRDWHYNAFSALLEIPRTDGIADDCVIVSTFSIHEARDATEFDPGFKDVYPHGLAGSRATITPAAPGIKGPIFFDKPPVIIPNVDLTESTEDGGVLFTEVPPGYYWLQPSNQDARLAPFMAHCENGRIINASPPWGFYELKPGEQPDPAVNAVAPDKSVNARVARRAVSRRQGKRRIVIVRLNAGEPLKARLVVRAGRRNLGGSKLLSLSAGSRRVAAVIRRSARKGPAKVTLTLRDNAGNVSRTDLGVRIPR